MADAVQQLAPRSRPRPMTAAEPDAPQREPVPLAERSQWGRKLAAGEFLTTVEIVPPRGVDPAKMIDGVRLLKEAGIDGVNVPDGPRAQSRMGVLATSLLIQQQVGIEPVIHYCCRDRNLLGMLSDLLGAQALGLRNLLLITGDPPKMGPYPDATAVFDIDAIGLTNLAARLNRGLDPGGNAIGEPTSFVLGVGVNPGAADFDREMSRFYWKVDAGAEYAITQPVFDPAQLRRFLEHIDREGFSHPHHRGYLAAGQRTQRRVPRQRSARRGGAGRGARPHAHRELAGQGARYRRRNSDRARDARRRAPADSGRAG